MSEEIEITILNWDKHQPKSDQVRNPHWFKIKNDIVISESLCELTPSQKWGWLCLLSQASRKRSATFVVKIDFFSHHSGVSKNDILKLVDILTKNGTLTVNSAETPQKLRVDQNRLDKIRKEYIAHSANGAVRNGLVLDFEEVYKSYPRKQGKQKGLRACYKFIKSKNDYDNLVLAVSNYSQYLRQKEKDKEHTLYFSSFMSEWEDWINPDSTVITKEEKLVWE